MKVTEFEIINHGQHNSQYFQGCGTYGTKYDMVYTGCGMNAKEAYNDAVEQIAMTGENCDMLPTRPKGIRNRPNVPANSDDIYYYVSIRFNVN